MRIIIIINFSNIEGKEQTCETIVRLNNSEGGEWKNKEDKCKMVKKGSPKVKNKNKILWKYILKL